MAALVLFGSFSALSIVSPEGPSARSVPPIVTKQQAERYSSMAVTVSLLLYVMYKSKEKVITIAREADREILSTCPIPLNDYFSALTVADALTAFAYSVYWINAAYVTNGGNLSKALCLPLLITVTALALGLLFRVLSFILLAGSSRKPLALALVYLAASGLHSLALMAPSPLLTLPFLPLMCPIVLCFTLTEPSGQVVVESVPIYAAALPLSIVHSKAAGIAHPEHLKLQAEVYAQPEVVEDEQLPYGRPDKVIYELVLWRPLLSRSHVAFALVGLASSILPGNLLRALTRGNYSTSLLPVVAALLFYLMSFAMASAILPYFAPIRVFRVYGGSFKVLSNAVMLRLLVYMLELAAGLALFLSSLTERREYLLLPLAASPAASASAAVTLLAFAFILPRKRLVRYAEGLTTMQVVFLITLSGTAVFLAPLLIFVMLLELRASWLPVYAAAAAVALAALVHYLGVEILSELLRTRDVAS